MKAAELLLTAAALFTGTSFASKPPRRHYFEESDAPRRSFSPPTSSSLHRSVSSDQSVRSDYTATTSFNSLSSRIPFRGADSQRPPSPAHHMINQLLEDTEPFFLDDPRAYPSSFDSTFSGGLSSPAFADRMGSPLIQIFGDRNSDVASPGPLAVAMDTVGDLWEVITASYPASSVEAHPEWARCVEYLGSILVELEPVLHEDDHTTLGCISIMQEVVMSPPSYKPAGAAAAHKSSEPSSPRASSNSNIMKSMIGRVFHQPYSAPGNVQLVVIHFCAYLVSRFLLEKVELNILVKKSMPRLSFWPDVLDRDTAFKKTFIPLSVVRILKGLIPAEESAPSSTYEFRPAEEALYLVNFYVPGGKRFMQALRSIDDALSRTMRHFVFITPLSKDPLQHKAALHLAQMIFSPTLHLAAQMPSADVDPADHIALSSSWQQKQPLSWTELRSAWESLRLEWPHKEMDSEGIFGVDCLFLRLLAKSLTTGNQFDGVHILKTANSFLSDPIPHGTLVHFAKCLAHSERVDLVALPMMIYHLISPRTVRENHFDPLHLMPLLKVWFNNVNTVALDRAAKLRAALYFKQPLWWESLRNEPLIIAAMFPEARISEDNPEEFVSLVQEPFAVPESVKKFETLKSNHPQWVTSLNEKPPHIQVMTAVLEFLSSGIAANGNWISEHRWLFIVKQFAQEFNSAILTPPGAEPHAKTELLNRISDIQKICVVHLRSEEQDGIDSSWDNSPEIARLFDRDTHIFHSHLLEMSSDTIAKPAGGTSLAHAILTTMSDLLDRSK